MIEKISKDKNFREWKQTILNNGNIIMNMDIKGVVIRNDNEIKKILIDCSLQTPEGNNIKRCILMGKKSIVVVPMLICNDNIYTLMVEQRRIAHGGISVEFPAGEVSDIDNLQEAAVCEIDEEINMNIKPTELISLNPEPIFISPDCTYNAVYFYYFKKHVSRKFLIENDLNKTGVNEDGEYLKTRVFLMKKAKNILTPSAIIGVRLLEKHLNTVYN